MLRTTSEPLKVTPGPHFQEEMKPKKIPALPSQAIVSENSPALLPQESISNRNRNYILPKQTTQEQPHNPNPSSRLSNDHLNALMAQL